MTHCADVNKYKRLIMKGELAKVNRYRCCREVIFVVAQSDRVRHMAPFVEQCSIFFWFTDKFFHSRKIIVCGN